jgi:hypothetical protein
LKKTLEDLMSTDFGRYIADVSLVAPKPTTFNVELINSQDFIIYYNGKNNFTVKVSGKKYNPINIGELERASQAITDLLELRYAPAESKEQLSSQNDAGIKQDLAASNSPEPELTPSAPEVTPLSATPASEKETPEEEETT